MFTKDQFTKCSDQVNYIEIIENTSIKNYDYEEILHCYCTQKLKEEAIDFLRNKVKDKCYDWFQTFTLNKFL